MIGWRLCSAYRGISPCVLSAKGALLMLAWGIAPGPRLSDKSSAEGAFQNGALDRIPYGK